MTRAELLGGKIPKIGLIKRDMTKLGAGFEPAVRWRQQPVALWSRHQQTPVGYEPNQRIVKQRIPQCPTCGETVTQEKNGQILPVTAGWLKSGKRTCRVCHAPLWQTQRDSGSRPKTGEKYPTKNPRYRLDEYLKRVYPDRVFLLIWDEAHEAQHGDTGNGQSFGRMAGIAQKVLAMTGTPFNGRSSSLFNLEYHLNPRIRQRFNWGRASRIDHKERGSRQYPAIISSSGYQRGRAESAWVDVMGVREQVTEERPTYDSQTGAYTGTTTYERPYQEAPGISPLLVAEVLDHSVFFSLGDLGKALPHYEEIALPVEMDDDTYQQYDRTRALLKDYLIQRRWEGDATFRGAYLQWSMGWVNRPHLPEQVIHNLKDPFSTEKRPHIVTQIPSYGEDRIYAKEQALIDLVKAELEADRPCVVYVRQTVTNDIQPRLEQLLRQHIPQAQPFILRNSVSAERREKVIEAERAKGMNILICNPELVKTGLDLLFTPTLIFYEITFNLSTMMQAAARAYRLNQTHTHCKTVYLYYEGTMEQTAVQLMSRKQRAAKLLTGELGLTGLEALTDGEGGLEEALMDAIGKEESLLDPSAMFKADSTAIDAEDQAFWAAEVTEKSPVIPPVEIAPIQVQKEVNRWTKLTDYLDDIHLIYDDEKRMSLQTELLQLIETQPEASVISAWLKANRFVFAGCEDESAAEIMRLAGYTAPTSKIISFESFRKEAKSKPRRKVDLSAAPDMIDFPPPVKSKRKRLSNADEQPLQLALF